MKRLLTALLILTAGPGFAQCAGSLSASASFGTVCQGQYDTLHVTDLPGWTYAWAPAAALSCNTCADPVVAPSATTTFTVVGTDPGGCTDTASVMVTVVPLPNILITPDAPAYCAGDTANLVLTGGAGIAYTATPLPFSTAGGQFHFVVYAGMPAITITGVNMAGCVDTAQINLAAGIPNLTAMANAPSYCLGDPVQLSATGAASYEWHDPLNICSFSCQSCVSTYVTGLTPGVINFQVIGTSAAGCTDTTAVNVTIGMPASATITYPDVVCQGSTLSPTITGMTGGVFSASPSGILIDAATGEVTTAGTTGTYTIAYTTASTGGCTASADTEAVTIIPAPSATIDYPPTACLNAGAVPVTLTGSSSGTFSVTSGTAGIDTTYGLLDLSTATPGTDNIITYTIAPVAGCPGLVTTDTITIFPAPDMQLSLSATTICAGGSALLTTDFQVAISPVDYLSCVNASCDSVLLSPFSSMGYTVVGADANGCLDTEYVVVMVNPCDSVWPGDANNDLVVNNDDILEIGLGYGWTGPARAATSIVFVASYADDWAQTLPTYGNNAKHADCNGDGVIDDSDTTAVSQNYGLTHLRGQHSPQAKITGLPSLYLDVPGPTYPASPIALMFGDAASPAEGIYGISGKILVQGTQPQQPATMEFNAGSWLSSGGNAIQFQKGISNSRTDFTMVRGSHTAASGFGPLAMVQFYPSNYTDTLVLVLSDIKVIDSNGLELTGYNVLDDTVVLTAPTSVAGVRGQGGSLSVYPNPTQSNAASLYIGLPHNAMTHIAITDALGQSVWHSRQYVSARSAQGVALPESLAPGIYLIRVTTADGTALPVARWVRR